MSAAALAACLARHTSSNGGSSDTEVKLLTVSPAGSPSSLRQVTTVTPVAKQPSASRKVRGSCPLRYSCRVGRSAIRAFYAGERRGPVAAPPFQGGGGFKGIPQGSGRPG